MDGDGSGMTTSGFSGLFSSTSSSSAGFMGSSSLMGSSGLVGSFVSPSSLKIVGSRVYFFIIIIDQPFYILFFFVSIFFLMLTLTHTVDLSAA